MIDERTAITVIGIITAYLAGVVTNYLTKRREGQDAAVVAERKSEADLAATERKTVADMYVTLIAEHRLTVERLQDENEKLRVALSESEAREEKWRAVWSDTYNAGRIALMRGASGAEPNA